LEFSHLADERRGDHRGDSGEALEDNGIWVLGEQLSHVLVVFAQVVVEQLGLQGELAGAERFTNGLIDVARHPFELAHLLHGLLHVLDDEPLIALYRETGRDIWPYIHMAFAHRHDCEWA